MTEASAQVEVYTDGGCDPNPGPGGWGAILVYGLRTKELAGAERATTNNRMELTAAIQALGAIKRPCAITLYTDSQYLHLGITAWLAGWQARGWRRADGRPVENVDLWQALAEEARRHQITWEWLRGHRGHPLNERADQLARTARQKLLAGDAPDAAVQAVDAAPLAKVSLYGRGCALGAPGPGGYAALLVFSSGRTQAVAGGEAETTSNVMELRAAIAGLGALKQSFHVTLYTGSKYLLDAATRWLAHWERHGWRTRDGQPVKNQELWQRLSQALGDHDVTWQHLSDKRNPQGLAASALARTEAERYKHG